MTEKELINRVETFLQNSPIHQELGPQWSEDGKIAFANGLEEACVGFSMKKWGEPFVVYDVEKSIQILINRDLMDYEGAQEFLEYNTWDLWVDGVWGSIIIKQGLHYDFNDTILDFNPDAITFPKFSNALVGILERKCSPSRNIYSLRGCIKIEAELCELPKNLATKNVVTKFFSDVTKNSPALLWSISDLN